MILSAPRKHGTLIRVIEGAMGKTVLRVGIEAIAEDAEDEEDEY
jgi:hypothetical protein